jgi:hypothetical protein
VINSGRKYALQCPPKPFNSAFHTGSQLQLVGAVKVTHPFIPQHKDEHELIDRRLTCGQDRVVYLNKNGDFATIPTSWTDVAEPDLFNQQSKGRCNFRYADLAELARLLKNLKKRKS